MAETPSSTENYLEQLASGLEALGPAETEEVVAEIRAHLAEAISDAAGDESAVFARFGSPDALATRILEERGVLATGSSLPEAPERLRLVALAADIAIWSVVAILVYMFLVAPTALFMFVGSPSLPVVVPAWTAALLAIAASVWWWAKTRRKPGYTTTGMRLSGLRRIRVGQTSRVVRERDVPGLARRRKLLPVLGTAAAVLVLALFVYAIFSSIADNNRSQAQSGIQGDVGDSSTGVSMVSDAYRQVLAGSYSLTARDAMAGLVQRRASGKIETYSIESVEIPDASTYGAGYPQPSRTIVVFVTMDEYAKGSDTPSAYRYRVSCQIKPEGNGISGGSWVIDSAAPVSQ